MNSYKIGTRIKWKWAGGIVEGVVEEIHQGPIEMILKGSRIKRNGTVEKPAYLVRSRAGNLALKLHTELLPLDSE